MGVVDILQVLRNGDMLTTAEIQERSGCGMPSVKNSIRSLLKDITEDLEFRILTPEEKFKRYGHRLGSRVRIYWLKA